MSSKVQALSATELAFLQPNFLWRDRVVSHALLLHLVYRIVVTNY